MSDTVIRIENVSKLYRLGMIGTGTLAHDLNRWWARVRGKEDPYAKIGQVNDRTQEADGDYVWALKDIDLEVKQGEVLGIIGKNGAGKSTLLKLISRITAPTTGVIKAKGRVASLLEVGTGMHPEMTARENIYLNGAILGMKKREIAAKFDDIVEFAGCAMYVDTPLKRYSSGMKVRLGFAVAAFLEPEILIVDEVLAVGDAEFQKRAIGKMQDVSRTSGRTILFVSHNMGSINQLCPRSVWLDEGKVNDLGPTSKITSAYLQDGQQRDESHGPCVFDEDATKDAQVRSVSLVDHEGKPTRAFDCDRPVCVDIEFQVHRKVRGLYGYIDVRRRDGTVAMMSDSHDTPPNPLDGLPVGLHRLRLTIPARTLAPGEYEVYLTFASRSADDFQVDTPGIAGSFSLDDLTTKRGNGRTGFLSSLVHWEAEHTKGQELNERVSLQVQHD